MEFKKGQEIWIWTDSRAGGREIKTTIKSIGPKYITVNHYNTRFHRNTLREVDYTGCASYIIEDIVKYRITKSLNPIRQKLYRFDWYKLDNERTMAIHEIMKGLIGE